jgi:hypothetical protein
MTETIGWTCNNSLPTDILSGMHGSYGEFEITAELIMHQPTSGDYFDYMTPVGTCTTNLLESLT